MWCDDNSCSILCWNFAIAVLISFSMMAISVCGMVGLFGDSDKTFFQNILTFVLGVWVKTPEITKSKSISNKDKRNTDL